MRAPEREGGAGEPADGSDTVGRSQSGEAPSVPAEMRARWSRPGVLALWFGWFRSQPVLASAFLSFCLVAVGGLVAILPPGTLSVGRSDRSASGGWVGSSGARSSTAPSEASGARPSSQEPAEAPAAEPGPWVEPPPSPPSARGLSLVYRYRTLAPGGESRYEWIVQVRGASAVLEGVDMVSWRMEPAAKNGADFVSRNRAADGFPLFGDGPGGWFGVSATIRYQDGSEETLSRRIELSE